MCCIDRQCHYLIVIGFSFGPFDSPIGDPGEVYVTAPVMVRALVSGRDAAIDEDGAGDAGSDGASSGGYA